MTDPCSTSGGAPAPVRDLDRPARMPRHALGVILCFATPCMAQGPIGAPRSSPDARAQTSAGTPAASLRPARRPADERDEVRPFRVRVPQQALSELRRRIRATRWPDRETVADGSQGVQLHKLQGLVQYWGAAYDWRKAEARLNAFPQFVTTIDGLDIHFVHVRSRHPNALPIIISHGWPGSVFEQLALVGPLTDPTRYGGRAEDAFHVVIPSLPGFGFSARPTEPGWGPERVGQAWHVLMTRLGYTRYVAQGGDCGAFVVDQMGLQAPTGLLAIHTYRPATVPADVD